MPKLKPVFPKSAPWTKVPNHLLDRLLPDLTDTELRILLALVRQTWGWNREEKVTTLSYRRLQKLTGRRSEALAKALRSLAAKGLIHMPGKPTDRKPKTAAPESEGNKKQRQ